MRRSVLGILVVTVGMAAASNALAGNPNCPQPTLPGGIKPNNWSCPTSNQSVIKTNPAQGQTGSATSGPPWPNWPEPYKSLSHPPPEECRPYLSDWTKFEKCLLEKAHYPLDLPRLRRGKYEAWGQSNRGYNCYSYAVNAYDPTKSWVGTRKIDNSEMSYRQFINVIEGKGWIRADNRTADRILNSSANPIGGEERVIIFQTPDGSPQHAAMWDARGIFAKMGEFGVFRFESIDQMVGPLYGRPVQVYTNGWKR